ncbi:MAG: quinol dehydrogenase ferredoxin subunit NapH [Campylobacterales bacterium]|nr:quinol dehydrogenase ferredoxin subunit NapH [Campylobacterales bacterium]
MRHYKYLLMRRFSQIAILVLYIGANAWGWKILRGDLSASLLMGKIPLADPYAVVQIVVTGATLGMDIILGALIVTLFYGVIGGRAFCSWVCPINMITDTAGWLRRKLKFSEVQKRFYMSRSLRYWILGLSLILSAVMGVAVFELISPVSMAHRGAIFGMGMGGGALVVIFLFDLLVHENGWCGYICPLGASYALISKFSLIRVHHNANKCNDCRDCITVCPEKEVLHMINKSSESVLMGECTNCGRCVDVCKEDALGFSIRSQLKQPKDEE